MNRLLYVLKNAAFSGTVYAPPPLYRSLAKG
jgi:hypothetical protein